MTPLDRYQRAVEAGELSPDEAQAQAAHAFERVHRELVADHRRRTGLRARVGRLLGREPPPVPGLYVWGGVGTGKTHLFDLFHETLPFEEKLRLHFHRFMFLVHEQLRKLGERESPLEDVAEHFARRARVLCLDEMHVDDITDAMLMGGLLRGLFSRGVTLVTTSNIAPGDLYAGGLQREQFLPAIELIERHTHTVRLDNGIDWRLRALESAEIWHMPVDDAGERALGEAFERIVTVDRPRRDHIIVNGRDIPVIRWADGIAWFDFAAICDSPRSSSDYLEIARFFHTVLVSGIPVLDDSNNNAARRFINLVDTFYDRGVRLLATAEAEPESIYRGERLAFEFDRTISRLREMQTVEYLDTPHLA